MKLVDTTFLVDLIRGNKETIKILDKKEILLTTQINMFEMIRGLFLRNVSQEDRHKTMTLFEDMRVLPLDDSGIIKSAEISAEQLKKGEAIEDADCLIAGIALSKGVTTIITRNVKHFEQIKGLKVETY